MLLPELRIFAITFQVFFMRSELFRYEGSTAKLIDQEHRE
jgi:hypothetical protein